MLLIIVGLLISAYFVFFELCNIVFSLQSDIFFFIGPLAASFLYEYLCDLFYRLCLDPIPGEDHKQKWV